MGCTARELIVHYKHVGVSEDGSSAVIIADIGPSPCAVEGFHIEWLAAGFHRLVAHLKSILISFYYLMK